MKKSLYILAAAAIVAGCASNDLRNDVVKDSPIGFTKVYVEKNTRAYTDVNSLEQPNNTFGVFGYKTVGTGSSAVESKVFGERDGETAGVKVTFGTDWTYSPLRYWDKVADHYDFYAYAPHKDQFTATSVTLASNDGTTFAINKFRQTTSQSTMVDLLTDLTSKVNYTSKENDVQFAFSHILSNINIRMAVGADLKGDEANNPVTVTSVSVGAIKMDGSYAYSSGYKWTLDDPQVTAATTFNATEVSTGIVFASGSLKAISADKTGGGSLDAALVDVNASAVKGLTDLLFIPQTVIDDYVINVTYKIQNEVFSKTIKLNEFKKSTDSSVSSTIWEPGKRYTYVLIIGPTPILFDVASVGDWADGGTYTYTIQ